MQLLKKAARKPMQPRVWGELMYRRGNEITPFKLREIARNSNNAHNLWKALSTFFGEN
jgi:hypothetical protein